MTTGSNIIWATDDYTHLGSDFAASESITVDSITGQNLGIISPRVEKSKQRQGTRAKTNAEVFTPSWLCNEQNNQVDEEWFRRPQVFNRSIGHDWRKTAGPIRFEDAGDRTWHRYVDEPRLEAACGEAPYLVSRYDATSGDPIALDRRIGLLDRKMRVVSEQCRDEDEWLRWARRAFESVYGFEFQGDSLLLARENLLASYVDYAQRDLRRQPTDDELAAVAEIIAWNIWQMDAITGTIPLRPSGSRLRPSKHSGPRDDDPPCLIRDWRANKTVEFRLLLRGSAAR